MSDFETNAIGTKDALRKACEALGAFSCDCGAVCEEGERNKLIIPKMLCAHHQASAARDEARKLLEE